MSALYHRVSWSPSVRLWMRRLDHAGIYLLIAGTYTPICLLALDGLWRATALSLVSLAAAAAIVLKFTWVAARDVQLMAPEVFDPRQPSSQALPPKEW